MGLQEVRTFDQVMFCNYCHEKPAAGLIEEEVDGEIHGRSACMECAQEQGVTVTGKVTNVEL